MFKLSSENCAVLFVGGSYGFYCETDGCCNAAKVCPERKPSSLCGCGTSMICFNMEGRWIFTNCWRQANVSKFVVCAVGLFELHLHVEYLAGSWLALGSSPFLVSSEVETL